MCLATERRPRLVNALIGRDHFTADDFAAADAIVSDFFDRGGQPAIAYGIVAGGELVHSAGFGARVLGAGPPDADTVFRIASMSKSFTASAILLLRDAGALALDDPAAQYVPELAGWTGGSADAAPVTIRQLLTMTAGFPTDDPWGTGSRGCRSPRSTSCWRAGSRSTGRRGPGSSTPTSATRSSAGS